MRWPENGLRDSCESLLGYAVFNRSLQQLVAQIVARLDAEPSTGSRPWLACINPHSYVVAKKDSEFRHALQEASWLVPDGSGIVLASKILGGAIRQRITGSAIFDGVSAAVNAQRPFSVMFVGSTEDTLGLIAQRFRSEFPNARQVYTFSPPFRDQFSDADVDRIAAAVSAHHPDLLWIGLTAPKQELLLRMLCNTANFGFAGAIGAVFDFYAGNVRRSPRAFRQLGLEWLPRLLQQPRRLWRRTFISAPLFLRDVLLALIARTS